MIRLRQSGVDEIIIKRARDWYDPGPGCFFSGISGTASFSPTSLFAAGEQGVYFDPNNTATLFEDAAGTIPTALERPVGLMLDLSGRGNHATSSSTARPTLTRRVNLLSNTENISAAGWTKGGATAASTSSLLETATTGAHSCTLSPTTVAATYIYSVKIKANGRTRFAIAGTSSFGGNLGNGVVFDLSTGSYVSGATGTPSITALADGWYQVSYTWTAFAASGVLGIFLVDSGTNTSYAGDVTKGMFIKEADLRPANIGVGLPAYQRVGDTSVNAADYDTAGFPAWLRCSGGQSMVTPSIDFTGTDKMTVSAGIRKLSDAARGMLLELSTFATNPGAFYFAAPDIGGANNYGMFLNGSDYYQPTSFAAPITNVVSVLFNRAGSTLAEKIIPRINGVANQTNGGTGSETGNFGNYPLYLFARNQSGLFFNGLAGPIIVRGAQSSAAEIANAEAWINAQQKVY